MLGSYLAASRWQDLQIDVLYSVYGDGRMVPTDMASSGTYQPVRDVPVVVLCRISDSEKRLEGDFTATVIVEGAWGKLYQVSGSGAAVGLVLAVSKAFDAATVLPDMVHFLCAEDELPENSIVKALYEGKAVRYFMVGPAGNDAKPHDLIVVTKSRWFRSRNNPKFLGFSKDEK